MGEVIEVDFKAGKKVQKYIITNWKCLVCKTVFQNDSRKDDNVPRVILREGTKQRSEECICKDCCLDIKATVEEQKWEYAE